MSNDENEDETTRIGKRRWAFGDYPTQLGAAGELMSTLPSDGGRDERAANEMQPLDATVASTGRPGISITKDELRNVPASSLRPTSRIIQVRPFEGARTSGKAITALVFGIVGIPLMGLLVGPFAIIFGGWAIYEINRTNYLKGKSLATAAISLGLFDIIIWIVFFIILILNSGLIVPRAPAPGFLTF
jgi:hypothetical protein